MHLLMALDILVKEYVKQKKQEHRVTLLQNEIRVTALANIYRAAHLCSPYEIIAILDGDDWLAHPKVLVHLNQIYQNPDVWLTYGQFVYYPSNHPGFGNEVPNNVILQNAFRSFNYGTVHLRSFYAGLFHQIKRRIFTP